MKIKRILGAITIIALLAGSLPLIGGMSSSFAQDVKYESITPELAEQLTEIYQQKQALTSAQRKVDSRIMQVSREVKERVSKSRRGKTPDLSDLSTPLLQLDRTGNIEVKLNVTSMTAAQLNRLKNLGMDITQTRPKYGVIEGSIPYDRVEAVAGLDFIKNVGPPSYMLCHTGEVTSEGDAVITAATTRATYGIDGSGSKIGVISDGVDHRAASVATGDLPSSPPVEVVQPGSGDEGTAMLEIIHDLAPGAELAFYSPNSSEDMADGILALEAVGCNIIVDDLAWSDEPKFEDGLIAQTARGFVQRGGVYASSCGNSAQRHYNAPYYRDGAVEVTIGETLYNYYAHDYAGGGVDIGNDFTVPDEAGVVIILQWNNEWGLSGDDFDLYLISGTTILNLSWNVQDGDDDPYEWLVYYNDTGLPVDVWIGVFEYNLISEPEDMVLDYHVWYGSGLDYVTPEDSVIGHAAVEEVLSTAAADAATPGKIEDFSSCGPSTIYFPTYEERQVPNITGYDGVQTKIGQLGYFYNPFYGTSASAPHVAAVAALVWEANPELTSTEVFNAITSTAIDMPPGGWDGTWGYGRAEAYDAVTSIMPEGIGLTVMNRDGLPAVGAKVHAYDGAFGYPVESGMTDSSGYTFLDVPDGDYTLAISSFDDNFYIVKVIAAPLSLTVYAADETVPVAIDASKVNGGPLDFGIIYANISEAWPEYIGYTNSSGEITVYMTPYTYRDIFLWSWDDLYYLYHSGITIPELGSTVLFDAAEMPTGECETTLVAFTDADLISWLEVPDETWTAPRFAVEDGDTTVLSEGGYFLELELRKTDFEDNEWYFELEPIYTEITPDCHIILQAGGDFGASVESGASSYDPGDTVNLYTLIFDSFDHRIAGSGIDIIDIVDNPDTEYSSLSTVRSGDNPVSFDSWERNYPTLTVTDPNEAVFLEETTDQLFSYYSFDLPNDATHGIWTANISFDTGPHQGVIEDTTTFSVGMEFICGDVNDDGNVNMADVMMLWYDIADYPSAGAWTISNEWAADVNCDSEINMADVMMLWYDIADYPSAGAWEINCCE